MLTQKPGYAIGSRILRLATERACHVHKHAAKKIPTSAYPAVNEHVIDTLDHFAPLSPGVRRSLQKAMFTQSAPRLKYETGNHLKVWPRNDPALVEQTLRRWVHDCKSPADSDRAANAITTKYVTIASLLSAFPACKLTLAQAVEVLPNGSTQEAAIRVCQHLNTIG